MLRLLLVGALSGVLAVLLLALNSTTLTFPSSSWSSFLLVGSSCPSKTEEGEKRREKDVQHSAKRVLSQPLK